MRGAPENDRCHAAVGAEVFFETAWERGCRALGAGAGAGERWFDIGGFKVRMTLGGRLAGRFFAAFEHLRMSRQDSWDLDIRAWDSAASGVPMPAPPWGTEDYGRRGEIRGFNDARFMTAFDHGSGALSLVDRASGRAVYWIRDGGRVPGHERGAPFRAILNGWMGNHGCMLAHGAAVGIGDGAVLLAGPGGSGKSTTALICAEGGMLFLGDDYCLLRTHPSLEVCSLYGTAKMTREDLARLPGLAARVSPEPGPQGKALLFLAGAMPGRFASRLPLRAVLLPRVTGRAGTTLRMAGASEALRSLAPSSIFQLSGAGAGAFDLLSGLVRRLPCYHLDLGTDYSGIAPVVREILSGAGAR